METIDTTLASVSYAAPEGPGLHFGFAIRVGAVVVDAGVETETGMDIETEEIMVSLGAHLLQPVPTLDHYGFSPKLNSGVNLSHDCVDHLHQGWPCHEHPHPCLNSE